MESMVQEFYKNAADIKSFWEQRMAESLEEMVKSQQFIKTMTKSLEASLDARQFIDSSISRWADMFQVVTKKDLVVLQQQMFDQNLRLEKSLQVLQDIHAGLREQAGADSASSGATRPRDGAGTATENVTDNEMAADASTDARPASKPAQQRKGHFSTQRSKR